MTKPTISIVMPSFNQGKYINQAISSIVSQAGEFYIDLIIKDGGSTDNAVAIIQDFQQSLHTNCELKEHNGLKFYTGGIVSCLGISYRWTSKKDNGFADAINRGIEIAKGDILGYLNTDDYLLDGALNLVHETFQRNPHIGVVYGEGWEVNEKGKVITRYGTKIVQENNLANGNFLAQPSVFVAMPEVKKVGLFNEQIKNSIDYEYWLRLQSRGVEFLYVPNVLSATRIYAGTKTMSNREQIILETMAIQQMYGGDLPATDPEFIWGMSWIGRYSWLFIRIETASRNFLLRCLTWLWLRRRQSKISSLQQRIFG